MKFKFDRSNPTHILSIFAIGFILLSIPLTVILSLQSEQASRKAQAAGTRDPYKQPFASDSPWNMPIGSNALYTPANLGTPSGYFTENEYVYTDPSSPLRNLMDNGKWPATCGGGTNKAQVRMPDGVLIEQGGPSYMPNNAAGALKSDNSTIQEFLYASRCSGTGDVYTGFTMCSYSIYGSGGIGQYCGHGGSGLSAVGGSLRAWERASGTPIKHALKLTLPASTLNNDSSSTQCNDGYRWPAIIADNGWNSPGGNSEYSGSVKDLCMGSLLALPTSTNCQTLVSGDLERRVCQALQDYGAYVVDIHPTASGWRPFTINGEPGASLSSSQMITIFSNLNVITNSSSTSVGGGGTPRVPLADPVCTISPCGSGDTTAPMVSLTSPNNGQILTSTSVTLNASASDTVGVAKVEFFVDGAKIGEDASSPYSYNWTGTAGSHSAYATALDAANNKGTSATNSFTINISTPDTTPPSVSLTSPTNGSILSSTSVSLAANTSDSGGAISKVEFYGDGVLRNTDTSSPYSYTWSTSEGSHTAYAKAFDSASPTPNSKVSTTVSFTVTLPPVVDSDGDGFNDNLEGVIGTFTDRTCGINAWPPDFNSDNVVNSGDQAMLAARIPSRTGDTKYSKRFDLNTDGGLDLADQNIIANYFLKNRYCKGVIFGWIQTDIGNGLAGSSTFSGGVYTLKGSGDDIWNSSDSFRALYGGKWKDQTFTARVTSQTNTNEWAKAGIMMRESTAGGAKNVFVYITPSHGIGFQYRNSTNASSVYVNPNTTCTFPNCWLRLKRVGNTFTAYRSTNGTSWTQVGSVTFPMNYTVYDTLAVTAHDSTKLSTATFDNVSKTYP